MAVIAVLAVVDTCATIAAIAVQHGQQQFPPAIPGNPDGAVHTGVAPHTEVVSEPGAEQGTGLGPGPGTESLPGGVGVWLCGVGVGLRGVGV
jgi:hypothetical protein